MESSFLIDLSKSLTLKPDHEKRPIWITNNNIIILEAFSKHYAQAYDFLINISEPISRPTYFHTYRLTEDSLYSAVAVSRDTNSIIKYLNILCKTEVPREVEKFIRDCTYTFGKAKLVLKDNCFFIESYYPDVLRELLKNPDISAARVMAPPALSLSNDVNSAVGQEFLQSVAPKEDRRNLDYIRLDDEEGDDAGDGDEGLDEYTATTKKTVSFMISQNLVQAVKRSAMEVSKYPLMEEYDFRLDTKNPVLPIDLRPSTVIRPYQEKSLSKMFGNGRARSGIIVLPCGAGKSLTGVTAASTIKKSTMILCINNASVKQWKEQFTQWSNVPENRLKAFTSSNKEMLPPATEACIVMTTYSMLCHSGKRSESAEVMMKAVTCREWGLMILDEVHVAPAEMFQKVLQIVNAHCKLGLTATLVREDNKIKDLSFLVGPKLYEANWMDLTRDQYLARVQCVEVWCPMTKEFYAEYLRCGMGRHSRTQKLLYLLNPRKFRACEYLVKYHSARSDKIIIFSDDLPALFLYCTLLKDVQPVPYICGETSEEDRRKYLAEFRTNPVMTCIGLSAVGDTALDIPEANVVIQVSSHFGARRQEAQRLGRILRPKSNQVGAFNAFFYTLVSTDTKEMYFSAKRQQYLIDQGYTFKVVQDLVDKADKESVILRSWAQEKKLLTTALSFQCEAYDAEESRVLEKSNRGEVEADEDDGQSRKSGVKRKVSSLGALSGV